MNIFKRIKKWINKLLGKRDNRINIYYDKLLMEQMKEQIPFEHFAKEKTMPQDDSKIIKFKGLTTNGE